MLHRPIIAAPAREQDQRRGPRHAAVLLIGRVRHDSGESACLVHDISGGGLMARFTMTPHVGDRLRIAVRGLAEVAATVRWVDDVRAGVEFDDVQDVRGIFRLRDDRGHIARTPRFAMTASAGLRIADRRIAVDILDISPGGVKLRSDAPIEMGEAGSVMLPGIAAAAFGSVCWAHEGRLGFRFCAPLSLASLSRVLGRG